MVATRTKRKSLIKELEGSNGEVAWDRRAIVEEITQFYKDLYTEENISRLF